MENPPREQDHHFWLCYWPLQLGGTMTSGEDISPLVALKDIRSQHVIQLAISHTALKYQLWMELAFSLFFFFIKVTF